MRRVIFLSVAMMTIFGILQGYSTGQGNQPVPNQKITLREARAVLDTLIEMKDFQNSMKLQDFLKLVDRNLAAKGKKFPIFLDKESFKLANHDAPPVGDTQINIPSDVKVATVSNTMEFACAQVPTGNAVFDFFNGGFVITAAIPANNGMVGKGVLVDATQKVKLLESLKFLNTTIDMKDLQAPKKLSVCLGVLREKFTTQKKKFPVFVDVMSFKKANPDAILVNDVIVKFPPNLKTAKVGEILRIICSQLPGNNAQFPYNDGYFYITAWN